MEQIQYPNYNGTPFEKCCAHGRRLGNESCIKFGYIHEFAKESKYCKSCFSIKQHRYYEANRERLATKAKSKYVKKSKLFQILNEIYSKF